MATGEGFTIFDVRCDCGRGGWLPPQESSGFGAVFVRSGCFRRLNDGVEAVLDPTAVYFEAPGHEQQIAHPYDGGDRCTGIELAPELLASLLGGDPTPPAVPVFSTPATDLLQRQLLAGAHRAPDAFEVEEHVVMLLAGVLERVEAPRVASGRPTTSSLRRRIVGAAREAIAGDPRIALVALARQVAVSPHHLSRVFAAETGETISRYRNRLRTRLALERIADGDASLARIAADLGFCDHAHLTRIVRREAGSTPSDLRDLLRFGA
jgi:AraC-like DNA-binding protein